VRTPGDQACCRAVTHRFTVPVQNLSPHRDATATAKGQGLKRCHQACCRHVSASNSRQKTSCSTCKQYPDKVVVLSGRMNDI
jgi:hypothetical protein